MEKSKLNLFIFYSSIRVCTILFIIYLVYPYVYFKFAPSPISLLFISSVISLIYLISFKIILGLFVISLGILDKIYLLKDINFNEIFSMNVCLHIYFILLLILLILLLKIYFIKENTINFLLLILISCISRFIFIQVKYYLILYDIPLYIVYILIFIIILTFTLYRYVFLKKLFIIKEFIIIAYNFLIILTFWLLISLFSIFLDYDLLIIDIVSIYILFSNLQNDIIYPFNKLCYNTINYLWNLIKQFIINIYQLFYPERYFKLNRHFYTEFIGNNYYTSKKCLFNKNLSFKYHYINNKNIKYVSKWYIDPLNISPIYNRNIINILFDTFKIYINMILNNHHININNVIVNDEIRSGINLGIGEKPHLFSLYGGPNNPLRIHEDISSKNLYDPNDAFINEFYPYKAKVKNTIRNPFTNNLNTFSQQIAGNYIYFKNLIVRVEHNYPKLINYIRMSYMENKKPYIMLYLNKKLLSINIESDEIKRIMFYYNMNDTHNPSYFLSRIGTDTSKIEEVIARSYYYWINYSRELNTLNRALLYYNYGYSQYKWDYFFWYERQIAHFMADDLPELCKIKPNFSNITYSNYSCHANMFNHYNFMDELYENKLYIQLRILYHSLLLDQCKTININNYNEDEFFYNLIIKYSDIILKSKVFSELNSINKNRYNNFLRYLDFIEFKRYHKDPMFKNICNTVLNHRRDYKRGILGLNMSSKKFCPVLWDNSLTMERLVKQNEFFILNK